MENNRFLQIVAKIVSMLLHPLLMSFYVLALIFNIQSIFALIPSATKWYCFLVTGITLFLIPLLCMPILKYFRLIRDFSLENDMDRIWVLLVTGASTFFGFWLLSDISYTDVIQRFYLILMILEASSLSITSKWKISLHMVGIGGVCGLLFILGYKYFAHTSVWLMIWFLLAGLLGSSRLYLGKHTPAQVYVGFILGNLFTTLLF